MLDGKSNSKIIAAIREAEEKTTGEIRVHLSKRWIERDPMKTARKIFHKAELHGSLHKNSVLLYVNLRRKHFAIVGDQGIHDHVGQVYWERIVRELAQDLRSTHRDNAIAIAIQKIGDTLAKAFPAEADEHH